MPHYGIYTQYPFKKSSLAINHKLVLNKCRRIAHHLIYVFIDQINRSDGKLAIDIWINSIVKVSEIDFLCIHTLNRTRFLIRGRPVPAI